MSLHQPGPLPTQLPPTLGAKTAAGSLSVTLPTDQAALAVTPPANQTVNLTQVAGATVAGGVAGWLE